MLFRTDKFPLHKETAGMVYIFGKDTWPYTVAARENYERQQIAVDYINVKQDPAGLERMLKYSNGRRDVPVIVDDGTVTIGYGGSWKV